MGNNIESQNGSSIHAINLPLVSVFMPVYNQELYITAALDSVLSQTYINYEIVISDDCSHDSTPEIVKQFADKYPQKINFYKLSNQNLGDRHFGLLLQKCKGEFVCMFSGDDIMHPEKIARQINEVLLFGLSFHGHSVDCIDKKGAVFSNMGPIENKLFKGNGLFILNNIPTAGCSWMVQRSYAQFGAMNGYLHDFDMVIRVLQDGRVGYVSTEKLGCYRVTNTSWSNNLVLKDYLRAYCNTFVCWMKSGLYTECLLLAVRIIMRLSISRLYKIIFR